MRKEEMSAGGSIIYRHEAPESPPTYAEEDSAYLERVARHVETHIGPVRNVFHEIVSTHVHLDILVVDPTPQRNFYTLVTCGMGMRPMNVPEGAEAWRFAELMLCLPANWPLSESAFRDEDHYWPVRMNITPGSIWRTRSRTAIRPSLMPTIRSLPARSCRFRRRFKPPMTSLR